MNDPDLTKPVTRSDLLRAIEAIIVTSDPDAVRIELRELIDEWRQRDADVAAGHAGTSSPRAS